MPLLAPGETFHSSESSKLSYKSLVTISTTSPPGMVWSNPFSTFHPLSGKESRLNPRHFSTPVPSNNTSQPEPVDLSAAWFKETHEEKPINAEARMKMRIW